ncbi:helix-turn-helix domain-containing protein [Filimonas effusa]|uniref:AraC family transcriptional regulator n=1 Tax=Filimonas effusa TaxID=2508721 RepID=A0A4V1MAU3_9BACT|nr:response regulator transcription factor [Filimonas effusa]RXK87076.1 AraC family transcriptional regulator [Filimonas effusa]
MAEGKTYRIKTITEFHRLRGLPQPEHPLISVIDYAAIKHSTDNNPINWFFDFYSISVKRGANTRLKYGQQLCDFDEGVMFFMAPSQVLRVEVPHDDNATTRNEGWILLVHPDFLWNTPLAKKIKKYEYFDYAVHEGLFLSDKEEATIKTIVQNIRQEYQANIDKFSQELIIAQLELLLTYSERFYQRQFLTRKVASHTILTRLEEMLDAYFNDAALASKGLPSVQLIAAELNVSPGYLSGLLKTLTGQSTQQHIHDKLIEKAKEKLSTTDLSVSEIAYELGFEHPQSFSKLFKAKTNTSPLDFRQSFN